MAKKKLAERKFSDGIVRTSLWHGNEILHANILLHDNIPKC